MKYQRITLLVAVGLALSLAVPALAQDEEGRRGRRRGGGDRAGQEDGGRRGRGGDARRGAFGRGGMSFGSMDRARLIGLEQVRKELEVKEEQAEKIDAALASHREEARKLRPERGRRGRGEGGDREGAPSAEERQKQREELQAKMNALEEKFVTTLGSILEAKQLERLNQIHYQQQGLSALVMASTVKTLELEKEQVQKIQDALAKQQEERRELFSGFRRGGERPDMEAFRKKMEELQKKTETDVLAVLSDKQKEGHQKLSGKEFKLDRRALFQRGGRGGNRGEGQGPRREGRSRRRPADEGTEV